MSYLADFLFPPERARAKVKSLSGGERNRLLLARLLSRPVNLLMLDEPTNDLDLETLELLEALLQDYAGTVFLVSHDREFLNNVVTQVIAFEGGGRLVEYPGGYDDWLAMRPRIEAGTSPPAAPPRAKPERERSAARLKLSYKESQELAGLPAHIDALEREQRELTGALGDGELYRRDPERVAAFKRRFDEIEEELSQALTRWEALENKRAASGQ